MEVLLVGVEGLRYTVKDAEKGGPEVEGVWYLFELGAGVGCALSSLCVGVLGGASSVGPRGCHGNICVELVVQSAVD